MSNIEHLIENALIAMTETKEDKYQAFVNEMSRWYNQQMLKEVSITEKELWEIAQYIVYTWIPNIEAEPVKHGRTYTVHEVAEILADEYGDICACNFNGNDEWLPMKCELLDACPNPVGVACWEQFLKWRDSKEVDNG